MSHPTREQAARWTAAAGATLAWGAWWLALAWQRCARQALCERPAGPWLPCGSQDWQGALAIALLSTALLGLITAVRWHRSTSRAGRLPAPVSTHSIR